MGKKTPQAESAGRPNGEKKIKGVGRWGQLTQWAWPSRREAGLGLAGLWTGWIDEEVEGAQSTRAGEHSFIFDERKQAQRDLQRRWTSRKKMAPTGVMAGVERRGGGVGDGQLRPETRP